MTTYILRRLLLMIPTLIGVTAVVFFVMAFSPGGVGGPALGAGGEMNAQQRQAMREYYTKRYHLDESKPQQYLHWLNRVSPLGWKYDAAGNRAGFGLKWPDLGESMAKRRPVLDLYAEALPITLLLNFISIPISYVLSIAMGIYAAKHRGKWIDHTTSTVTLLLYSIPTNWAAVMMVGFLASVQYVYIFPPNGLHDVRSAGMAFLPHFAAGGWQRGWLFDTSWHLILPIICYTYGGFAFLTKLTRGAVLDNLSSDYIRTARAKGIDERRILFTHVFRNSLLPLITAFAGILPALISGSVIVETIFSIPGMGKLSIDAIFARDRELILAGTLIAGILGLLSRLISDVCYTIADPRVSYE